MIAHRPVPYFDRPEYESRLARIYAAMEVKGIDLLVVTGPANMYYVCGYDAETYYTTQAVLVAPGIGDPIWIGRAMDAISAEATMFSEPAHILPYPETALDTPDNLEVRHIADVIRSRGLGTARIGLELGDYYLNVATVETLKAALPDARFVDAGRLVNWVRTVKTPAEITYMRQAGQIAVGAQATALAHIAPGVRQCDAMAEAARMQLRGLPEFGGDWPCSIVFTSAGKDGVIHVPYGDHPFLAGQAVTCELGASRRRYHAALVRTKVLGPVPQPLRDLESAVLDAMAAAGELIRPGAVAEDIAARFNAGLRARGFSKDARVGYAIGIGVPPTWGENTYSIRAGDKTVLEEGMTFHFNLGMWARDQNYAVSETVLVRAGGYDSLTPFPKIIVEG